MPINQSIKQQLFQQCEAYVAQKIAAAQKGMQDAQNAANNETKSSVGDKYETGRAMMHLEKNKYAIQLGEAIQLKQQLSEITPTKHCEVVENSSLIKTNKGNFYIAISLGKVALEGEKYYVVSLASPLGKALYQSKKGDSVAFRNIKYQILELV